MIYHELTIEAALALLRNREISAVELTRSVLDRIESVDGTIRAYITVSAEEALKQAEQADRAYADGTAAPLAGIPLGVKDVICTEGIRTTCGSKILKDFVPPYNAGAMEKLEDAGAILLGKLNMDEFAMGSSTEHSAFMATRNPWDKNRTPGGSSGGSAAAVAADMCIGALGSDTGGSIRQPASHCGVVGMKPTYGRVSRFGLVAYASSLDQIGPMTKTVTDNALLMNAIAGYDGRDSTSVPQNVPDYTDSLGKDLKGVRVGIPKEYNNVEGTDPEVKSAVEKAIETIIGLGAEPVEVSLPHSDYVVAAYYIIAPCEASSNLARYDGVKYGYRTENANNLLDMYHRTRSTGFGIEVQRRIIIGTYALSAGYYDAYYGKASQVRTLVMEDFHRAFENCDALLAPVAPTPAFKFGEKTEDPLTMYLCDIFTLSANLAGIPGISVPCGFSSEGLPIGLQILGKHFDEEILLNIAYQFEQATDWHTRKPDVESG